MADDRIAVITRAHNGPDSAGMINRNVGFTVAVKVCCYWRPRWPAEAQHSDHTIGRSLYGPGTVGIHRDVGLSVAVVIRGHWRGIRTAQRYRHDRGIRRAFDRPQTIKIRRFIGYSVAVVICWHRDFTSAAESDHSRAVVGQTSNRPDSV